MKNRTWNILTAVLLVMVLTVPMAVSAGGWESPDLSWKKNTKPATFSLFFNMTWAPFDVWGTDHVSQQVTKDTGISFETTKSQNAQHMAAIVATGELPDAFFVFGGANIDLLEDPAVCYPWDELIPQYAPEFMDMIDPTEIAMATKDDGHFYTLYTHVRNQDYWDDPTKGVSYGQSVLSFRQDIMEELGNPVIDSIDDFYNLLKQVKEKYPNMIPYMQQATNADALAYCFGIDFEGSKGMSTIIDGQAKYVYGVREPVEGYLKFANKLVREGLMSQEALVYTFEQTKAAILGGDVFCFASQAFDVDQVNKAISEIPGDIRYYNAMRNYLTVDGEMRASLTYGSGGFAGFYITRACKDPGRLIQLMEYMKSPYGDQLTQWGVQGLDYELVEGNPIQNDTYTWKERGDNVWYFQASFEAENQKAIASIFWPMAVITDVWKEMGWWSIIFLAAMTGIDLAQYESARVDGASRIQCIWYITLPNIKGTMAVVLILSIGALMSGGMGGSNFDQSYLFGNTLNYSRSVTLPYHIYYMGLTKMRFSYATAAGLFQSAISLILVLTSNAISNKVSGYGFF